MTHDEAYFLVMLLYGAMYVFTGVSYAVFVTYLILKKFSDFGDTTCKLSDYSVRGIGYYRAVDDCPNMEKSFLFTKYGEDPYVNIDHKIPEVLLKNARNEGDN